MKTAENDIDREFTRMNTNPKRTDFMGVNLCPFVVENVSQQARERFLRLERRPLFLADWGPARFFHFEVDAEALQRDVPFPLDLRDGRAFVSLVAFSQRRLRPPWGGALTAWIGWIAANHDFLNFRTYVKGGGETGIYFLAEWVNHALAPFFGPRMYEFPYRFGRIDFQEGGSGLSAATVTGSPFRSAGWPTNGAFRFHITGRDACATIGQSCASGSLDEFLLERYMAFTQRGNVRRFFRIWHEPWPQVPLEVEIEEMSLFTEWPWMNEARWVGANESPGVRDVRIGRPRSCLAREGEKS